MNTNSLYQSLLGPLRDALAERCRKDKIAGLSLVLADASGPVLAVNHGYADLGARIPCTEDTLMGIASVTKLFTATGIMQQVEAGKIDLYAPVSKYISEFSIQSREADATPIRVIDLMTHHAGLPRDWLQHCYTYDPEPFSVIIDRLHGEYASRPANTFYSYSNVGVTVLGVLLERVSGIPYEAYIREHILKPIGMETSGFDRDYAHAGLYAQTYDGLKLRAELPHRDKPAGGLFASAKELGHFIGLYLSGGTYEGHKILAPETINQMLTAQNDDVTMDFHKKMGLNWHLNRPALEYAGRVAHHGGALVCYRSELCILPDQGLGIAIVSNSSTATQAILELAEFGLQEALACKTGMRPEKPGVTPYTPRPGVIEATPEGHYATSRGYVHIRPALNGYEFLWRQRRLYLAPGRDGSHTLHRRSAGVLTPDASFASAPLRFCIDQRTGKKVLLIGIWPDGEAFTPQPVPDCWAERKGTYSAINRLPDEAFADIMHSIKLSVKHGLLHMESIGPDYTETRVLEAVNDGEAVRLGWTQSDGETLFACEEGGSPMLRYMGLIFHKIN